MEGTFEQYRWLVGEEAEALLREHAQRAADPLKALASLRHVLPPERAALIYEQLQLRRRAARKFARADRMFFTRLCLEQSTGEVVATYKVERYGFAGSVADLCCGIGGDLISLAGPETTDGASRSVVGVDRDAVVSLLAQANGRQLGLRAVIETGDVSTVDVAQFDAWHIDPDRRSDGRRTTSLDSIEPSLSVLEDLLAMNINAAIKLAPATDVPQRWQQQAELEWISWQRECRQQVAWFGRLAESSDRNTAGLRRATCLSSDGRQRTFVVGEADTEPHVTAQVARYVYDPDPAVLAAALSGALAVQCGLAALGSDALYLTGDALVANQPLSGFEVTDVVPGDLRRIKQLFSARNLRKVEVKKRGVPNEIADKVRKLKTNGDRDATLILAQPQDRVIAILAHRIVHDRASFVELSGGY